MPIKRLNHAVLYVRDVQRSAAFYQDALGFRVVAMTPEGFSGAVFLQAPSSTNDHDLGLFEIGAGAGPSLAGRATVGLYHLAWEVDTLGGVAADRRARAGGRHHPGRTRPPRGGADRARPRAGRRGRPDPRPPGSGRAGAAGAGRAACRAAAPWLVRHRRRDPDA